MNLEQLAIYPVKSMRGLTLSHAQIWPTGLAFDRQFMLTDQKGKFITARQWPKLLCFTPTLINDGLVLTAPDKKQQIITYSQFEATPKITEIWQNRLTSFPALPFINQWISNYMPMPVQLRWLGECHHIRHYPNYPLSFADRYPFLLVNRTSFAALQHRCPTSLDLMQFRANLIIDGDIAFSEDSWKTIQIGEIIFDVVTPCSRCIITTINVQTGQYSPHREPLVTLEQFRKNELGHIDFGIYIIARNAGVLRLCDPVTVLATQPPHRYFDHTKKQKKIIKSNKLKKIIIEFEGNTFIGNNQQPLLEQLEQQGFLVNFSCRMGFCNHCHLRLLNGEVTPLTPSAVQKNEIILACSCIPKTDIRLCYLNEIT